MRRARARQETVLHLKGSPHALAVTYGVLTSMTLGGLAVVLLDPGGLFARIPPEIHAVLGSTPALTVGVVIAFLFAVSAFNHGRRWRTARAVERLSNDPALARYLPLGTPTASRCQAATRPMLQVRVVEPPLSRKRPKPLYWVTERSNVVCRPPLSILYLRVFENNARARTFVTGAWREFGYVHLSRSAAAVDPAVYRAARRDGRLDRLFLSNTAELRLALEHARLTHDCECRPARPTPPDGAWGAHPAPLTSTMLGVRRSGHAESIDHRRLTGVR
jgi:hypothetical protein